VALVLLTWRGEKPPQWTNKLCGVRAQGPGAGRLADYLTYNGMLLTSISGEGEVGLAMAGQAKHTGEMAELLLRLVARPATTCLTEAERAALRALATNGPLRLTVRAKPPPKRLFADLRALWEEFTTANESDNAAR
jgi:hypothetical protein